MHIAVVLCSRQYLSVKITKCNNSYIMRKVGTIIVLCTSSHRDRFKLLPLKVSLVCFRNGICKFSETTEPTEAKYHVIPPCDGEKMESFFKFVVIHYCKPHGGWVI